MSSLSGVIMYSLYYLVSPSTSGFYIGITKRTIEQRFYVHSYTARSRKNLPLYNAMREYKDFCSILIDTFESIEDCSEAEVNHIAYARENNLSIYNMTSGGERGFSVDRGLSRDAWIIKLKEKRAGRKPALGMKHSELNKEVFSNSGKLRWDIYGRYPEDIILLSFKDAKSLYGISKTHYYRLKRASISDAG